MSRPLTDAERQVQPIYKAMDEVIALFDEVHPDWRLVEVWSLIREANDKLGNLDLSGEAKPIYPVRAFETKRRFTSSDGVETTQLGLRDDWDGTIEWPS